MEKLALKLLAKIPKHEKSSPPPITSPNDSPKLSAIVERQSQHDELSPNARISARPRRNINFRSPNQLAASRQSADDGHESLLSSKSESPNNESTSLFSATERSDAVKIQRIHDDNFDRDADPKNGSSPEEINDEVVIVSSTARDTILTATLSTTDHEAIDIRGRKPEIRNVEPEARSSAKGTDKTIQPRTKKAPSGNAHSIDSTNADISSPRLFRGLAELPTYSPKRGAFSLAREVDAKLNGFRKYLPAGAILDKQGNLSGRYQFTKYPSPRSEDPTFRVPPPLIEDAISEKLSKFLDFEAERKFNRPVALNGIVVASLAKADFHRLTYEFKNVDGSVRDLPLPTKTEVDEYLAYNNYSEDYRETAKEILRARQIAQVLLDFVSDENTTGEEKSNTALVLSSLLTQATSELLAFVVYGQESALRMFKTHSAKDKPETNIIDSNGQLKPVIAKQFGATKFSVSREGADFLIAVDFPTYAEARPGYENEVPLHKDTVLGIHTATEILVDRDAARNKILSVKLPSGIQAAYSGRIALN